MGKYVTSFTKGYCDHWTISKAITEFVSNFLDSEGEQEFEFTEDSITLTNKNIIVSNKLILSGCTDKKFDNNQRGYYGQGSMQAMCVLTALGIGVSIHNGDVLWDARFEMNPQFEMEVLVVDETPTYNSNDFSVCISGLSEDDIKEVKQRCTNFQEREVLHSTKIGDIICGTEGELFVGGIYVTQNKDFKYSYNFNPSVVPLSSDRNCMDPWELKKLTAKLISLIDDEEFVKEAIEANSYDTSLVHERYYTGKSYSKDTHAAVATLGAEFVEDHEGKLVTDDYSEHEENIKLGNPSVYMDNRAKVKAIQESDSYQESIANIELAEKMTPFEVTESITEDIKEILDNRVSAETANEIKKYLDLLLEKSEDWEGDIVYVGSPF